MVSQRFVLFPLLIVLADCHKFRVHIDNGLHAEVLLMSCGKRVVLYMTASASDVQLAPMLARQCTGTELLFDQSVVLTASTIHERQHPRIDGIVGLNGGIFPQFSVFPIPRTYYKFDSSSPGVGIETMGEFDTGVWDVSAKCFDDQASLVYIPLDQNYKRMWVSHDAKVFANGKLVAKKITVAIRPEASISRTGISSFFADGQETFPQEHSKVEIEFAGISMTRSKTSQRQKIGHNYGAEELFVEYESSSDNVLILGQNFLNKFVFFFDSKKRQVALCRPNWNYNYIN